MLYIFVVYRYIYMMCSVFIERYFDRGNLYNAYYYSKMQVSFHF